MLAALSTARTYGCAMLCLRSMYFTLEFRRKRASLDAAGRSSENVAEILNQTNMMLGHEIFDPEVGRRVLVDHAYIVAGGEITKAARNWLGGAQPRLSAVRSCS
ncbi:MAG: hypothetical protein R3E47_10095 [Paracoccaceae bacterium]